MQQLTLKYKFMIPTLFLFTLCLGAATVFSFLKSHDALETAYTGQVVNLADNTAHKLEAWLSDHERALGTWAGLDVCRRALSQGGSARQALGGTLADIRENYPEFASLALLDGRGEVVASTAGLGALRAELTGKPYFQSAMAGKAGLSEAFAHPAGGLPVVAMAAPVSRAGGTGGVLLGILRIDSFSRQFIDTLKTGKTGYVYLCRADGLVMAHPKRSNWMKLHLAKYDFGQRLVREKDGVVRYVWEGVDKIVGFHQVDGPGWIVCATANCEELFAPAIEVRNSNIIMGLIALLAGAVLVWLVTMWVVRPIIRIIASLKQGSSSVAAAAGQISSSSQTLAQGASQQAASLEETSASLETLAAAIAQNSDDATKAEGIAQQARESMQAASRDMGELTGAMDEISRASRRTGDIVKSIDEIAFQTNLLALNAAVEAARAGQAGAGFAVVADEVRSLAQRAADAAHDTSRRIEATMAKARQASEVVSRTNDSFDGVARNSGRIMDLVIEIARASREQAQGLGQLSDAARQMDQTTQSNAVHSEESAAASEELFTQAEGMDRNLGDLASLVDGGNSRKTLVLAGGGRAAARAKAWLGHGRKALPAPSGL